MKERKATHITRKNYYLTPEDKQEIHNYIKKNPAATNTSIALKFDVSRTTIINVRKELQ